MSAERLTAALSDRYTIERELGAGGMATVYLAHDRKHDRKVALKVLKPELAAVVGAERFLAEIKTTANLQHPHILPLFDSGEADGFLYYVMPFVEGESLRERLDREKQLPVEEAVRIATEVADALGHAHSKGVIHRDIKPANILLPDGRVQVADFGIALAVNAAGGSRLTETGLSVGTPHYMSPEQATGDRELDGRSDVYSLGCVLYEMLAGEPPHTGPTAQAILSKILTEKPRPLKELRGSVPPNVEAAVHTAIGKLPADRFEDPGALRAALADASFRSAIFDSAGVPKAGPSSSATSTRVLAATAALAVALAALGWFRGGSSNPRPISWVILGTPEAPRQINEWGESVIISPDGRKFAYLGPDSLGRPGGKQGWWVQRLDSLLPPVWVFPYAMHARFSPDGEAMVFRMGHFRGEIQVKWLRTGRVTMLADSASGRGVAWGPDDWIYFTTWGYRTGRRDAGMVRVPAAGGNVERVAEIDPEAGEAYLGFPEALPNGRGLLLTVGREEGDSDICLLDLETGSRTTLVPGVVASYAASGHLVVAESDGALSAAPFDQDALRVTGPWTKILDGVNVPAGWRGADFDLSRTGDLVYVTKASGEVDEIVLIKEDGAIDEIVNGWTGRLRYPASSPDGTRIAATVFRDRESPNIYLMTLANGEVQPFTFGWGLRYRPKWVGHGREIIYTGPGPEDWDLYIKATDFTSPESVLLDVNGEILEAVVDPARAWAVFTRERAGNDDVMAVSLVDDGPHLEIAATGSQESNPSLSPDGRWVAYSSDETGRSEVWVQPFPDAAGGRQQVSLAGGADPAWSETGTELYFISEASEMVRADVRLSPSLSVFSRRPLFSVEGYKVQEFDRMPDGRFVFVRQIESGAPGKLVLVQGFFAEIEAREGR